MEHEQSRLLSGFLSHALTVRRVLHVPGGRILSGGAEARIDLSGRAFQIRHGRRQRHSQLRKARFHRRQIRDEDRRDSDPSPSGQAVASEIRGRPGPQIRTNGPRLRDQRKDHAEHRLHVRFRIHPAPRPGSHQLLLPPGIRLRPPPGDSPREKSFGRGPAGRRRPDRDEPAVDFRTGTRKAIAWYREMGWI